MKVLYMHVPTTPAAKKLFRPIPRPSKNSSGPSTLPYMWGGGRRERGTQDKEK